MRLDRLITLGVAHPLRRTFARGDGASVPILMYHSVSADPEPGVAAYYRTTTSPAVFQQQIRWLRDAGYHSMDLPVLVEQVRQQQPLPAKTVVITFDDGFRDFYTNAFPVLREHRFTATVFLPTAFIGSARHSFKEKECLTWNEVAELRQRGISFGSHTVNHPRLIELSWREIETELSASKRELEQRLGEPVSTFAHPYAFPQTDVEYVRMFKKLLIQVGYTCCATTEIGRLRPGADPYRLKRLPVNSLDDSALLAAKLDGAYDWLAGAQAFVKRCKQFVGPARGTSEAPLANVSSN